MPLANINFPPNAHFFLSILRDIVTFDIIPSDFIKYDMFIFSEIETERNFYDIDIFKIIASLLLILHQTTIGKHIFDIECFWLIILGFYNSIIIRIIALAFLVL